MDDVDCQVSAPVPLSLRAKDTGHGCEQIGGADACERRGLRSLPWILSFPVVDRLQGCVTQN